MANVATNNAGQLLEPLANLFLGSALSPTALAGNVNDYNPTGLATATRLRVNPGGASRNITGIAAQGAGKVLLLQNIAAVAENLVLKHEDGGSSAANRIIGANLADVTVRPGGSIWLVYDEVSLRWRTDAI